MMRMRPEPTSVSRGNAIFEPCPDGSLRVRNSTELGPYPGRLIERLQYWAAATPDRVLLASREGEGWRKITYLEALNAAPRSGRHWSIAVSPSSGPSSSCQAVESSMAC